MTMMMIGQMIIQWVGFLCTFNRILHQCPANTTTIMGLLH